MINKLVLASGNPKKIVELKEILTPLDCELVLQKDLGIDDAIEDGLSFVENALKKARHATSQSGLPALADDSGIEVDALQGKPGIYSARFAGEEANDQANNNKLLEELIEIPLEQRTARYQCVIVLLRHQYDPTPLICQGSWEGRILSTPEGTGGFGYDPLFYCPVSQTNAAKMTAQQKHAISHRGKALKLFQKTLSSLSDSYFKL